MIGMLEMESEATITNNYAPAFGQGTIAEMGKKLIGLATSEDIGGSFAAAGGGSASDNDYTLVSSLNTQQVYDGSEPPIVDLPLILLAFEDPKTEVEAAIAALNKMALPELNKVPIGGRMPPEVTVNLQRQIIVKKGRIENLMVQDFGAYSRKGTLWAKVNVTIKAMQMMSRDDRDNLADKFSQ